MPSGLKQLCAVSLAATTLTSVFTATKDTALSTIVVCNRGTAATSFRLAHAQAGAANQPGQYFAYDVPILANTMVPFTMGICVQAGDVLRAYAGNDQLTVIAWGEEDEVSSGGAATFLELTDTPNDYAGQEGKAVLVNAGATALEFGTASGASAVPFRGCLLKRSTLATGINASTLYTVLWDSEDYDTDTLHSTGTNPARITVPSGVTRLQLSAGLRLSNVSGTTGVAIYIRKNGTTNVSSSVHGAMGYTDAGSSLTSPVLSVVAGDYFEVMLLCSDTSIDIQADADNYFACEVVEPYAVGGGATTWLGLTDTPDSYTGQAGKVVQVNAGATALEYSTLTYEEGTFTVTGTGFSGTAPSGDARYARVGKQVTIRLPVISGTSNATTLTLTGWPPALWPDTMNVSNALYIPLRARDNSTVNAMGLLEFLPTPGAVNVYPTTQGGFSPWTASGSKTLFVSVLTYLLP